MSDSTESGRPAYLAVLTLGALGVVFGDIGTSPLYAFREAFTVADLEVSETGVLGVLSLILWALVLVVSIKYLSYVMRADNDGEGGILALTSLLIRKSSRSRGRLFLIGVGLFGTALLYGDGMITPAISVLSAVEGLEVAVPSLGPWVLLIAAVILVILFTNQHRGTGTLGTLFGPVMVVWFVVLAILGVAQIVREPAVLQALSPFEAIGFVASEPRFAFLALGGVFLVVTGSEALYADMGHFGTRPIRLAWFGLVFPALVLNYFGQGALLLRDPGAIENPFYNLAPDMFVLPLVVLATLATVIASQALISGAYSLTSQAIQLGYLPRQHVDHTSPREFGQIYVSTINWILMIAAVALVFSFGSSSNLAAAYGVGVATDMVITTLLLFVVMRDHWKWRPATVIGLTGVFLAVDLVFFGANITKIPDGGWFPLVIGVIGFTLMATWKKGKELMNARSKRTELPIERFIASISTHPPGRVKGTGVYLFNRAGATPPTLLTNLRHHEVLHETVVLVTVEVAGQPRIPQARRAAVHALGDGFFQVVLLYGFIEDPDVPEALRNIVSTSFGFDPVEATYFIGRETVLPSSLPGMQLWREHLFSFMHRNAASAARFFGLPADKVVEVGIQVPI
ncbi:MAG: potassium transporter Kup [Acidimicrobiia bacterium]|nr:potassium transporter Kup [Acidimicrobiia bacterium]MBT8218148.1 potassium transporter Kup [Acidimicrobiia bacterium]NNF08972.1 potassium transporter Kup [Acidimicrobiia bacterium]NNL70910.1 potassium transporter Kup [Acidimicrobiia bacterium]